jgi:hypothetical protein
MTSLKEKLIKIGAKVVSHGRYVAFQMAEVAIPRNVFADILRLIAELRPPHVASTAQVVRMRRVRSNSQERCASITENSALFDAASGAKPFERHRLLAATVSACRRRWNGAVFPSNWRPSGECRLMWRRPPKSP